MISQGGRCSKMPCESCGVQFSVFRRKRACSECERLYCAGCLRRGAGMCAPCRALSTRPLVRQAIAHLKARDLQCFLQRQNVSTRGCVEKEELVNLCVSHVNSAAYRRRGAAGGGGGPGGPGGPRPTGPFTSLKGLTTNINEFINSTFVRTPGPPYAQPPPNANSNCYNAAHAHAPPAAPGEYPAARRERFTTRPGGEPELELRAPPAPAPPAPADPASPPAPRADTADCYEIEDLDDAGWEFVTRPADPLPTDSEVLMTPSEAGATLSPDSALPERLRGARGGGGGGGLGGLRAGGTPQRAASELELRPGGTPPRSEEPDTTSLQDEPTMDSRPAEEGGEADEGAEGEGEGEGGGLDGGAAALASLRDEAALDGLNVKQLKELLARNRVEYRGCLEREELLERARRLYRDHAKYKDDVDNLPLEECCKICMAAPLECVLLECGHIAACTACSKQLSECPFCRQYVVRAVRFFRS